MKPRHIAIALAVALTACCATPKKVVHPKFGMFSGPTTTGTVTSVVAGTGLTGGTIVHSGTIAADTTYLQKRVTGTCASGNAVGTINADGTVTCNSAGGSGLSGLTTGDLVSATSATTGGNYGGSSPTACTAGQAITAAALSAAGVMTTTCTAFGSSSLTNSASANVVTKSDGTNLVASSISDNGTTVSTTENVVLGTNSASSLREDGTTSWCASCVITSSIGTSATNINAGNTAGTVGIGTSNTGGVTIGASGNSTTIAGALTSDSGENLVGEVAGSAATLSGGSGSVADVAISNALELDVDGASPYTIDGIAGGVAGRLLYVYNYSATVALTLAHEDTVTELTAANRIDFGASAQNYTLDAGRGIVLVYDGTNSRWHPVGGIQKSACSGGSYVSGIAQDGTLTCGTPATGITGTLTNGDLLVANSTSSATAFGGSTCAGSTVATAIAASGGLTCGVTPLTATNVSGTTNDLAKFTGTNTVGDSNFIDDGTTATLGTSKDTITESTGGMLINDSGTPTDSQIRMQGTTRTTSGTMAMEVNDTDAMYLYFDAEKVGGSIIATGSTVAYLSKSGGIFYIAGSMSSTAGSAFSAVVYDQLTLSTGLWEHKYAEKIDGNATLGNTDAALATVQGHLAGYNATAPTISSCGTSTLTTHSSDLDGKIVWDASSTACTLTFHTAFTNTPSCTLTYEDTNAKGYDAQWIHSAAASNIIIYQSSASGSTVNYHCVGMQQ